ncbi:MAG: ParB/RepB/Spo0J family partition protein [Firmicutes bacterium]|nr:ParB/RepB/Spo0J family partition protein [Bacillota bacterium]
MSKRGLGRGLESLLPGIGSEPESGLVDIQIDRIAISPHQPRKGFAEEKLAELAASIREHGVVQPIVVRRLEEGKYQLIAGERRLRACTALGMERIPAVIRESGDAEARELALVENIQREGLNPIEEAEAYRELTVAHGLTQEDLAKKLGKSRSHIANTLRLLALPDIIKNLVREGNLTMGHAKVLLGVNTGENMVKLGQLAKEKEMSVRELEELVWGQKSDPEPEDEKKRRADLDMEPDGVITRSEFREIETRWQKTLNTRVKIKWSPRGRGRIEIDLQSPEDISRLADLLGIE